MDTKSIVLEQVTLEQYRQFERCWGDNRKARPKEIYARVRNPIMAEYYEDLFLQLIRIPRADRIALLTGSDWIKYFTKRGVDHTKLREMARLARQNDFKINFLEFGLYPKGKRLAPPVIEFTEHDGMIVGYKVRVPGNQKDSFTIRANGEFDYINGLWVPN